MSSSNESPKELEEVTKAPTNAKNKRKGKKLLKLQVKEISCASSNGTNAMKRHTSRCKKAPFNVDTEQTILDFESKTKCNADGTIETELRKVGGAPDDEDWDKIASFLPFLQIFYETTLSFSGSRLVEALVCTQDWIRASHDPIIIEENLLALENMEEEMQDLTLEQPTIIIDETNEVPE
ncbi:hypothetical protein V6N11_045017 [Hibiscus sabdariffa]|uniref:HAT C-terminal dimerisation domain-containing protein n=1 Tax=Hibiscus sabdariffa TaxID=183260 RepID=A0ABR1ZAU7_9ROSI